jgi:hypothetical protein
MASQDLTSFAAVFACLVLGALGVFQVALALGAPLGRFAWGGQHRVLPIAFRVGSVISILVYALIATVVLARAELLWRDLPDGVVRTVIWVIVGYFFLGVAMNLASKSKAERLVMSVASAILCALCAVVAVS